MIGKSKIERMCRAAGIVPVSRETVNGTDVYIADGFSTRPDVTFQKFDIALEDYPFGCFATFWWTFEGEERHSLGRPLFFDAFHDSGYSAESKKHMRIKAALKDAGDMLAKRKKAAH